jgi:hypothetical protein
MKLPELKLRMKENNIQGYSSMKKSEMIAQLVGKGILSNEQVMKPEKPPKVINPKYAYLEGIRNSPKRVEIRDLETNTVNIYPSIHKANRAIGHKVIIGNNGKVWQGRYAIKVL